MTAHASPAIRAGTGEGALRVNIDRRAGVAPHRAPHNRHGSAGRLRLQERGANHRATNVDPFQQGVNYYLE